MKGQLEGVPQVAPKKTGFMSGLKSGLGGIGSGITKGVGSVGSGIAKGAGAVADGAVGVGKGV